MKLSTTYIPDNIFYSQNVAPAIFGEDGKSCAGEYRFGFQGQEKENEIYGAGNTYDLGLRIYDSRLGRMFSIDPRAREYSWQSPYVYHRNSPIAMIDFMGGGDPPTPIEPGTDDYYEKRAQDYENRNPGNDAPTYYREYGASNMSKFVNGGTPSDPNKLFPSGTRTVLSTEGKKWLDDTKILLQLAIEDKLAIEPSIEDNNRDFTKFAFQSHVDAYTYSHKNGAGLLALPVMDKLSVMLTVDPLDLTSRDGITQASEVGKRQLKYYAYNPVFALQQAKEVSDNYDQMVKMINSYVELYSPEIQEKVKSVISEITTFKF